jgi:A/G-specific adenine glycosylase
MELPADPLEDHDRIERIRQGLLAWFAVNGRNLPWRQTRDPYRILVSEVMLQQTQVDRVIPYYERWLELFPTAEALALAPTADVITAWSGLGYNRRAVNLQRTARAVVEQFGGEFPRDPEQLRALPGIGPYTAGAIAAFAFEQDVAFLDTNMRRVIHRLTEGSDLPALKVSEKVLLERAEELVPDGLGWVWNQALIEFGALHCTQRRPACVICPLQRECRAFPTIQSDIAALPAGVRLKREATFSGSNRQYRGRVVEALRQRPSLPLAELGQSVRDDFSPKDLPWLYGVVTGLARDGLVSVQEAGPSYTTDDPDPNLLVSLPD